MKYPPMYHVHNRYFNSISYKKNQPLQEKKMTMRERMLSGISKANARIIALDDLIQDASSLELRQELQQERKFWQDVIDDNNDVLEAMRIGGYKD